MSSGKFRLRWWAFSFQRLNRRGSGLVRKEIRKHSSGIQFAINSGVELTTHGPREFFLENEICSDGNIEKPQ
jgi:hypothetical protein